jgi:hypothetical protein
VAAGAGAAVVSAAPQRRQKRLLASFNVSQFGQFMLGSFA